MNTQKNKKNITKGRKPPPDHPDAFKYPSVPGGEQRSGPVFYKFPQKGV